MCAPPAPSVLAVRLPRPPDIKAQAPPPHPPSALPLLSALRLGRPHPISSH